MAHRPVRGRRRAHPVRNIIGSLLLLLVAAQAFRPDRSNPAVIAGQAIGESGPLPAEVASVLARSCFDCHSNATRWPWYSQVAPISWGVADDVHSGRRALNFSEWGAYTAKKRARTLETMCDEVREGGMPLTMYRTMHPGARLSAGQVQRVCDWTKTEIARLGQ
jgi:hypothetical protein